MNLRVGNIASGKDFFDRKRELEDLWRYLEGNHVALTGPRRLGKSSLLKRLSEEAQVRGLFAPMIDVQGLESVAEFLAAIDQACPEPILTEYTKAFSKSLRDWAARIGKVEGKLPGGLGASVELNPPKTAMTAPWAAEAARLQQRLADQPILLLVDEFSVFLERLIQRDRREAERMLGWLRAWRLGATSCRFVLSGSVGLNALLERHHLSTWLNDCYDYGLDPFRPQAAQDMLITLARREGWLLDAACATLLCDKTGWLSPFYLALLLDESLHAARDRVLECGNSEPQAVQSSDIESGYDRLLAGRSRFVHWYQRLSRDLAEPDLSFSLATLRAIAEAATPLSRSSLLARLGKLEAHPDRRSERLTVSLAYLEENGYVSATPNGELAFLSFLLRDYWRRNHAH